MESVYIKWGHQPVRMNSTHSAGKGLFLPCVLSLHTPQHALRETTGDLINSLMYGTKIICSKTKHLLLKAELGDSQQNSDQPLESNTAEI